MSEIFLFLFVHIGPLPHLEFPLVIATHIKGVPAMPNQAFKEKCFKTKCMLLARTLTMKQYISLNLMKELMRTNDITYKILIKGQRCQLELRCLQCQGDLVCFFFSSL